MKQFKEGDEAYIKCKILSVDEEDKFPITVEFSTNIDITFKTDGRYIDKDTEPCLFHLSDIQQSQFTDEELMFLIQLLKPHGKADLLVNNILDKINNLIQSPEEKQLLEMAEKFKDKYKIEKL